jgi:hypothetical protein
MIESDRFQSALQKVNIAMNLKTQNNHKTITGVNIYDSLPAAEDEDTVEPPPSNNWADEMENESTPTTTNWVDQTNDIIHDPPSTPGVTSTNRPSAHTNFIHVDRALLDDFLTNKYYKHDQLKWRCLTERPRREWLGGFEDISLYSEEVKLNTYHFLVSCMMAFYIYQQGRESKKRDSLLLSKYKPIVKKLMRDYDSTYRVGEQLIQALGDNYEGDCPRLILPIDPSDLWANDDFQENWVDDLTRLIMIDDSKFWRFPDKA